jgi:saccharopine dehydrogenase-like protein
MRSPSVGAPIAVFGATGEVGRRVCAELARAGAAIAIAGRHAAALAALARALPVAGVHVAEATDEAALARAVAGARVVVNAAGPLRDTAAPVLAAALAAGAHYIDVGGEQAVLRALYERHESAARKAGLVALPGAGVDCVLGDLAAAWAAAHLLGADDPGDPVRTAPAPRLADAQPLDDIAVSYVFDGLALSAGSQRALFGAIGTRAQIWRRDRWEPGPAGDHRRINAGAALGGERDAQAFAGGDPITIPRHVAARSVASYLSTTRHAGAATALRLLSRALPFVPRRAGELLVPYAEPGADYGRARLAVVAQVRRGFSAAQITVHGHDLYGTTAVIAAWSACRLAERAAGPVGMRAPGELFRAEPALRAIAHAAGLTIEPSFG